MIEVPEPPDQAACSTCGPLQWLYSKRREVWVAFIAAPEGGRYAIRPHPCRFAQDFPTWKQVHKGSPPSPEYVEFRRKAIKNKNITKEEQG